MHHIIYREPLEEGKLDDMKTLCSTCHRMEHGLSVWHPFDFKLRDFNRIMARNRIPSKADELELITLVEYEDQNREVEAMFRSVAEMRIILVSRERWASWVTKPKRVWSELWPWATRKRLRLEKELLNVR